MSEAMPTNQYDPNANQPNGPLEKPKRPGTVTAACVITILMSLLMGGLAALTAVGLSNPPAELEKEFDKAQRDLEGSGVEDFSYQELLDVTQIGAWVVVGLAVVGLLLALLTLGGQNWARILLLIASILTAVLTFYLIITLITGILVAILLFTGGANEWFKDRKRYKLA